MKFCAVINCIDGRVQLPVIRYLQHRFEAAYVDTITEPGPVLILAEQKNQQAVRSILGRLELSMKRHNPVGVAIVAHHDCAGNPVSEVKQIEQLRQAIRLLGEHHQGATIIGLWVNDQWVVSEISQDVAAS